MKVLFIVFPAFVIGALFGAFMWWAFSPLLFDKVVNDQIKVAATDQTIARGAFKGQDQAHKASGEATIISKADGSSELRLSNFSVTNGPDLKVYLSDRSAPKSAADVLSSKWVNVGELKGNKGDQLYSLPARINLEQVKSVIIWCEAFSFMFGSASLN